MLTGKFHLATRQMAPRNYDTESKKGNGRSDTEFWIIPRDFRNHIPPGCSEVFRSRHFSHRSRNITTAAIAGENSEVAPSWMYCTISTPCLSEGLQQTLTLIMALRCTCTLRQMQTRMEPGVWRSPQALLAT